MDIKRNWEKCVLAAVFGIVTILYFIALIDAGISFDFLGPISIATLVFLLGATLYFVFQCMDQSMAVNWTLLLVGAINLILIIIAFINVADVLSAFSFSGIVVTFLVPLAIYALLPLILGIKKVMDRE